MMKNKLLAVLTALTCIASCLPGIAASAADSGEKPSADKLKVVTGVAHEDGEYSYILDGSIVLDGCYVETYLGEGVELRCGTLLEISYESMDLLFPGIIAMGGENNYIRNLGSALSYYGKTEKLTVTECNDYGVTVELSDGRSYSYTQYDVGNQYRSVVDLENVAVGDTPTFVVDENGYPVYLAANGGTRYIVRYTTYPLADGKAVWYVETPGGSGLMTMYQSDFAGNLCTGSEMPEYGDVIEIGGEYLIAESYPGQFTKYGTHVVTTLGSAAELYGTAELTLTGAEGNHFTLTDAEGTVYEYYQESECLPLVIDMREWHTGDTGEFVMYDGKPRMPLSATPLGDANQDGALDVLDVIVLNRNIMGLGALPGAAARSGDFGQADFNGDGAIDGMDSLGVMKRIVGLE